MVCAKRRAANSSLKTARYNTVMSRGEEKAGRGQFTLQYALMVITIACIMLGSCCLAEDRTTPEWFRPICGAGLLGGFTGLIVLAILPFVRE